ncbi:MAG: hypothetical protein RBT63_08890 [Bdellovibrionales bacterium]|jgi:hypothetical protein|nr:hypothetical protein [Bdellovibrionales bacterium]
MGVVSVQLLNRRRVITLGFGFLFASLPMLQVFKRTANSQAAVDLDIKFPDGYTIDQYENDVPLWARNDEIREFIGSFSRNGRLIEYKKTLVATGVSYRFTFSSHQALREFVHGVRTQGLVNFEARAKRGLVTVMRVNGTEFSG